MYMIKIINSRKDRELRVLHREEVTVVSKAEKKN